MYMSEASGRVADVRLTCGGCKLTFPGGKQANRRWICCDDWLLISHRSALFDFSSSFYLELDRLYQGYIACTGLIYSHVVCTTIPLTPRVPYLLPIHFDLYAR